MDKYKKIGFIFDMDGTLVDNMMIHHKAWQIKLKALGVEMSLDEVRRTIHGKNDEIMERLFGEKYDAPTRALLAAEKEAEYRKVAKKNLQPIAGLVPFLQKAKAYNIAMGIGSAAPPENVDFGLALLDLKQYFHTIVDASQVTKGKPEPEVFLRVAHRLHCPIEDCIVFEDSPVGVATALNAGCKAVVITTTHTPDEFQTFPNVVKFISNYAETSIDDILSLMV